MWAVGGFIVLLGVANLILSFWQYKREKKKKKGQKLFKKLLLPSIALTLFGACVFTHYGYKSINPIPLAYEGTFEWEQRNSRTAPPLPFTWEYIFSSESQESKPSFYLDSFSRQNILPQGFEEGRSYRVWYDKTTRVILKVEILS